MPEGSSERTNDSRPIVRKGFKRTGKRKGKSKSLARMRGYKEEAAAERKLVRGRSSYRKSSKESLGKCMPWKGQPSEFT
jgi:hypothetical protein